MALADPQRPICLRRYHADDWTQIGAAIAAVKGRGVQARDRAVQKERIRAMKFIAQEDRQFVEAYRIFCDDKQRDLRRRNPDGVADVTRRGLTSKRRVDAAAMHQQRT